MIVRLYIFPKNPKDKIQWQTRGNVEAKKREHQFNGRIVCEEVSPYMLAEIGINYNVDMQFAKRLIDASFDTICNCVKIQKR